MSIKQYDLFDILIPQNFTNVKYTKENLYLGEIRNPFRRYKHTLEIHDISDINCQEKHLHEIYFFESEKYRKKYFSSNENLEKIDMHFKIHIDNDQDTFKSIIPILNIKDFKRLCNNFGIGLVEKNQTIVENPINNFSISNNIIYIDSKPTITLNHEIQLAKVSNVMQNITFETKLYYSLMETLDYLGGNKLNKLRNELHTLHFDVVDEKLIDNVILKLQNKLDITNN